MDPWKWGQTILVNLCWPRFSLTWWQSFLRQFACCESIQDGIQSLVVRCFAVLALLWLCRRCEVHQWTPLSRKRLSRLHRLWFIAAQYEQQSFFTITCTSVHREVFGSSPGIITGTNLCNSTHAHREVFRVKPRNHNWYKSLQQHARLIFRWRSTVFLIPPS